jgi:hypothetical protein
MPENHSFFARMFSADRCIPPLAPVDERNRRLGQTFRQSWTSVGLCLSFFLTLGAFGPPAYSFDRAENELKERKEEQFQALEKARNPKLGAVEAKAAAVEENQPKVVQRMPLGSR